MNAVAPLKQTAFRLTEGDLALLDEAQQRLGLISRTEALRYVLRQWAEREGVLKAADGKKPKRPATKKR